MKVLRAAMAGLLAAAAWAAPVSATTVCSAGEDNSGAITDITLNGGASVTISGWIRYCAPDSLAERHGMPAFRGHRLIGNEGDPISEHDSVGLNGGGLGAETGYREVTRQIDLPLYLTDVCVHFEEWSTHCWTVNTWLTKTGGTKVLVFGPNDHRLSVHSSAIVDPDPGCGNCWGED